VRLFGVCELCFIAELPTKPEDKVPLPTHPHCTPPQTAALASSLAARHPSHPDGLEDDSLPPAALEPLPDDVLDPWASAAKHLVGGGSVKVGVGGWGCRLAAGLLGVGRASLLFGLSSEPRMTCICLEPRKRAAITSNSLPPHHPKINLNPTLLIAVASDG